MSTRKQQALALIDQALALGVRGELRQHLVKAKAVASGDKVATFRHADCERLPVGGKLTDPDHAGLLLKHGRRAGRVWFARLVDENGNRSETKLGTFPAMTITEARAAWKDVKDGTFNDAVVLPAAVLTMGELVKKYLNEYARPTKRSWQMDETYLNRHVVPHYGNMPALEFNADHVRKILAPIARKAPREAEKVRGVMSSMFSVATKGSRKIGNLAGATWLPAGTPNPVMAVILPKREVATYRPSLGEVQRLMDFSRGHGDIGDLVSLQALTCARVTEVAGLLWAEVDLNAGRWLLPRERSKNGHEHLVMLPPKAQAILERRHAVTRSPYVFPKPKANGPMTRNAVGKFITNNRDAIGLGHGFTSHKLRHACLTWLAENGAGKEIRDRVSNHIDGASTDSIYVAAELNAPALEWLTRWGDAIDESNVIQLKRKKT